jgi:hypothetical protein
MITNTGKNLSILIVCDYIPCHHWMSFLAWYSFYRNIPEARVAVACNRLLMKHQLFDWTKRCNVPFVLRKSDTNLSHAKYFIEKGILSFPLLVLSSDVVAVRELDNVSIFDESFYSPKAMFLTEMSEPVENSKSLVFDVKRKDFQTFVTYENGWGKFVTSSWINKEIHPITPLWKYEDDEMSANERRLAELWKDFTPLFLAVKG